MDVSILRVSHAMASTVIPFSKPAVNAAIVKTNQIEGKSFLNYYNIQILDETGIHFFTT